MSGRAAPLPKTVTADLVARAIVASARSYGYDPVAACADQAKAGHHRRCLLPAAHAVRELTDAPLSALGRLLGLSPTNLGFAHAPPAQLAAKDAALAACRKAFEAEALSTSPAALPAVPKASAVTGGRAPLSEISLGPAARPNRPARKLDDSSGRQFTAPPKPEAALPPRVIEAPMHGPATGPRTLVQLGARQCRFPVGAATGADQLFCAEPCGDETYCPDHRARMRTKAAQAA